MGENESDDVIDKICAGTFPLVTLGIRAGNTLPPPGESYEFYQSYPAFQSWSRETRGRLLAMIQSLAQVHGRTVADNLPIEDFADSILESNDHILEVVGEKLGPILHKVSMKFQ